MSDIQYKVLSDDLTSPYQGQQYEIGRWYEELHRDGWYIGDTVICELCEEWLDEEEG